MKAFHCRHHPLFAPGLARLADGLEPRVRRVRTRTGPEQADIAMEAERDNAAGLNRRGLRGAPAQRASVISRAA